MAQEFHDSRVPESPCPVCGSLNDAASGPARQPAPGDAAVCLRCGALNLYGPDLRLEKCDPMKELEFLLDPGCAKTIKVVRQAVARRQASHR